MWNAMKESYIAVIRILSLECEWYIMIVIFSGLELKLLDMIIITAIYNCMNVVVKHVMACLVGIVRQSAY